jgi:hypothetical protein
VNLPIERDLISNTVHNLPNAAADMWKLRSVKSTKVSRLNVLAFKSILRSLISSASGSLPRVEKERS